MTHREALEILRHNVGFREPEPWIDYAVRHGFVRVEAKEIPRCPDCGDGPKAQIGQFVYYSTLMHLRECRTCGLIWADALLDSGVLHRHFERAYKDRDYFRHARRSTLERLAAEIDQVTPRAGSVLDVGGAQGDLMDLVRHRRADVDVTVQDLSESAARFAADHFGLRTIRGGIAALEAERRHYDVVVLSDVLYYEPDLARFWALLPRLVAPRGSVVIRVPNKLALIRSCQKLARVYRQLRSGRPVDSVPLFNPEHIYILSRPYLQRRLHGLGFLRCRVIPSPPLKSGNALQRAAASSIYVAALLAARLSGGRFVLTPSMVVVGTRVDRETG